MTTMGIATKNIVSGLLALCMLSCDGQRSRDTLKVLDLNGFSGLQNFFAHTGHDIPLLSAHRGGKLDGYPENSLAAFENVLKHTHAFFEVDPRLTKDSIIVLMHDKTLERTTTGFGKVSDHTLAELKRLRLKDEQGNVTEYQIPTLKEALDWSLGKTVLNLDKKDVPLSLTVKKLKEWRMEGHVMLTVHSAEEAKFYLDHSQKFMFSAFIRNKEEYKDYAKLQIPWGHMIAYVGPLDKPETKELYALLNGKGVMCMVSAAPTYDKEASEESRRTKYQQVIENGADILESDRPIEVSRALQHIVKSSSSSPKKAFFKEIVVN